MRTSVRSSQALLAGIEEVYRKRLPQLRRVAAALVGDPDAGLDAVQDAFANAIRHRHEYRQEGSLEAWLWRTVVNTAHDRRRALAAEPRPEVSTDRQANGHVSKDDRVAAAIVLLPERQRLAVFLRYYADLEYSAIAEALGISPGTVAASLNAAHASLRRSLEEVRP